MFFPLIKVLDLEGFLELSYMPPNNWENRIKKPLNIYALWPQNDTWKSEFQFEINYGDNVRVSTHNVNPEMLNSGVCLFYPTDEELVATLPVLPTKELWSSRIPEWRCTTGFSNGSAQTSYQSEIYPLPSKASMLTFHPFIQFGNLFNYLLVLNIVREPVVRECKVELYNSSDLRSFGVESLRTNSANLIHLDPFGFQPTDLPLFFSREMAGIPFGLGVSVDGSMLSLEHTHPPASFVLFGNRNSVQGDIKKRWIQRIGLVK